MRIISDIRGKDAIDLIADILEPASVILTNDHVKEAINTHDQLGIAKVILKEHSNEIVEILAAIKGIPPAEYTANVVEIFSDLMELLNDGELMSFFKSQALTITDGASTPVTETIQAEEP